MEYQQGEYCGDLVEGLPHGLGTMLYRPEDPLNREAYEGQWAGGCQCGEGSMKFRSGDTYQGSFQVWTLHSGQREWPYKGFFWLKVLSHLRHYTLTHRHKIGTPRQRSLDGRVVKLHF